MASSKQQPTNEERAARDVFTRLAAATDEFEGYAHPHAERIAALSDALAKLFNVGRVDRASLRLAALAHDLGEAAMKRDYISRAGALDVEERLDLARHPVIGEQESARAGADRAAQLTVRWSHEWWNGSGYPDTLRGGQIPLAARILRVADAYCALTDERPFRPARTEDEARRHLAEWAGIEFDPRVVKAFLSLHGLPELRSYARREDGNVQSSTQSNRNEPPVSPVRDSIKTEQAVTAESAMNEAATDKAVQGEASMNEAVSNDAQAGGRVSSHYEAADRSLGGRIPESGANPYAATNDAQAAGTASSEVADEE